MSERDLWPGTAIKGGDMALSLVLTVQRLDLCRWLTHRLTVTVVPDLCLLHRLIAVTNGQWKRQSGRDRKDGEEETLELEHESWRRSRYTIETFMSDSSFSLSYARAHALPPTTPSSRRQVPNIRSQDLGTCGL